jgi:hypothetical protein
MRQQKPLCPAIGLALALAAGGPASAQTSADQAIETCRAMQDSAARLRCYQQAVGPKAPAPPTAPAGPTALPNGWRLVRTPHPQGGADAVSVMRTADLARSDIDLAGLLLSCADAGVDVMIFVVAPFPPRAHPAVTVSAGGQDWPFTASVVPPGAELRLPPEASDLASGIWQTSRELSVTISSDGRETKGVISTEGLDRAMAALQATCPLR